MEITDILLQRILNLEAEMQQVRDGTLGWETKRKARAYLGSTQDIVSGDFTKVNLDTITFDPQSIFNSTLHRIIIPIPGYYLIVGSINYKEVTADRAYRLDVYKNGAGHYLYGYWHSSITGYITLKASDILHLDKNDYLELYTRHGAGVNQEISSGSIYTFMSIHLLSKD